MSADIAAYEIDKLRNEIARLKGQTNWVCKCGGTDCEGQKENAALRELVGTLGAPNHINVPIEQWRELRADKERLDWMASADYWADIAVYRTPQALRAAIDAARKEAQP